MFSYPKAAMERAMKEERDCSASVADRGRGSLSQSDGQNPSNPKRLT
jgi:hypothetical protein